MRNLLLFILAVMTFTWASPKPMEPLDHYNVVLVHGAAPSGSGFESECSSNTINDAWTLQNDYLKDYKHKPWNLGGAAGMMGAYNDGGEKKLTYWLDSAVFEDYQYRDGAIHMDSTNLLSSPSIYIQRSFANPAASPAHNALEIGDKVRRALFEEAQEVRAEGQYNLEKLRKSTTAKYRSIPSRNILIAHSMGGLAARGYVQSDYYNDDVDKAIMLDSPHEGTVNLPDVILFVRIGDSIEIHRVWRQG